MSRRVVPLGRAVGIKLFSDGVLVVGLSAIETDQGSKSPGKDCGLKLGDVITHVDGDQVDTIQQMQDQVERHKGQPLTIQAMRGEKQVQLTAAPVANRQGTYQLGVWLRDSMAGIGRPGPRHQRCGHCVADAFRVRGHHGGHRVRGGAGPGGRARGAPRGF